MRVNPGQDIGKGNLLELIVSDVKQCAYCQRIPYYHYILPVERPVSYKMGHGKEAQVDFQFLERRRKFWAYGLHSGERLFNVWLRSHRLGLSGKLDLLIRTSEAYYPVDFKHTEGRPHRNHILQLAAYALLVEDAFGRPVDRCFIYLIPQKDVVGFDITPEDKQEVVRVLGEIRRMVETEAMPGPSSMRARCQDCEFQNYCADIW